MRRWTGRMAIAVVGMTAFASCKANLAPAGRSTLGLTRKAVVKRPPIVVPPPAPPPAVPATVASGVKLELITRDADLAVAMVAVPGEKAGRLFVVDKPGRIRVLRGAAFDPAPFLDLTGQVATGPGNSEQGLLGLAFHPAFAKSGRFYVNFTDRKGDTRVIEMRVGVKDYAGRADPSWKREVLFVHQPYSNHNGGSLAFAPDGKLMVLLGDGGSGGDPQGNAQNPQSLLGKMIRIDVDAPVATPEILSKGLRNPWRFTFDRKTGDLYIADVGQNIFEYVHFVTADKIAGHNFGWNIVEGLHCFGKATCDTAGLTRAFIEYPHSEGCSITGGYVYRGKALPELDGNYFFSDYCTGILRSFRMKDGKAVDSWDWKKALDPDSTLAKIAAFGEDQDGELFIVSHEGPIWKLVRK